MDPNHRPTGSPFHCGKVSGTFKTRPLKADALRGWASLSRVHFADSCFFRAGPRDCRHGRQAIHRPPPTTAPCGVGDTLSERNQVRFTGLPQLRAGNPAPRCNCAIRPRPSNCARHWTTSAIEGVIQVFYPEIGSQHIVGRCGPASAGSAGFAAGGGIQGRSGARASSPFATARWISRATKRCSMNSPVSTARTWPADRDGDFVFMGQKPVGRELSGREEPGADLLGDEGAVKGGTFPARRGTSGKIAPCCKRPRLRGGSQLQIAMRGVFWPKASPMHDTGPTSPDLHLEAPPPQLRGLGRGRANRRRWLVARAGATYARLVGLGPPMPLPPPEFTM